MLDKQQLKRKVLLVPCKDKAALNNWFKTYLGVELFDTIVSRDATSSPLDAAWELYKFAMFPEGNTPESFLYASSRTTQKTLLLAAVETILALHSRRDELHYAAAVEQVKPARKYMRDFAQKPLIIDLLKDEPTTDNIIYLVPKYDEPLWIQGKTGKEIFSINTELVREVTVELAGISGATTQGKHFSICSIDEVSSLKGEKISFYKDIKKVPIASFDGKPYLVFKISTRRGAYSVVEKEIEEAHKTGLKVRRWTVLEGVQKCDDSRSGTDFVHPRYVNTVQGSVLTEEEYKLLDLKKKGDFDLVNFASGCLTCELKCPCRTDLKKQKSKSKFLQPIEAAIVEYKSSERDFYNSQCLSLMPSKEGLVFSRFDDNIHCVTPSEMYQIFMGEKPPREMSLNDIIVLFRTKGLKFYAGLDWGHTDPTALTIIATDGARAFILESFAKTGMEPYKDVVPLIHQFQSRYGKLDIYPDTARPDNNATLRTAGFNIFDHFKKEIDSGITKIKGFISPTVGPTRFFMLKGTNEPLLNEIKKYHYIQNPDGTMSDDIADDFNHNVDCVRYVFLNVFADGNSVLFSVGEDKVKEKVNVKNFQDAPFLQNFQETISNKSSELSGTSGGFSWDFGNDNDD